MLLAVTRGYSGLMRVTVGDKRLQGITRGYKGLQGVTGNYMRLQEVLRGYKKVLKDYKRLQGVKGG